MVLLAKPPELDKLCFSSSFSSWQCSVCLLPGHLTHWSSETTQQMEALHRPRGLDCLAEQTPSAQPGVVMMLYNIISISTAPTPGHSPLISPGPLPQGQSSWLGFAGCSFYQCWVLDLRFFPEALCFLLAVCTSLPDPHSWPEAKNKVLAMWLKLL